jgi:Domain of unknown function (DUF4281)
MNYELYYKIFNALVLIPWLMMIVLPEWRITQETIKSYFAPVLIGAIYTLFTVTHINYSDGGFTSLAGLKIMFQEEGLLLVGWIHYLCLDLFAGSWMFQDAQKNGMKHHILLPCLVLTLLLAPIGVLVYFLIRYFLYRNTKLS